MEEKIEEWTTYKTDNGASRVTYHSEWSKSKPWCCYRDGTATINFATLGEARKYFSSYGMKLKTTQE